MVVPGLVVKVGAATLIVYTAYNGKPPEFIEKPLNRIADAISNHTAGASQNSKPDTPVRPFPLSRTPMAAQDNFQFEAREQSVPALSGKPSYVFIGTVRKNNKTQAAFECIDFGAYDLCSQLPFTLLPNNQRAHMFLSAEDIKTAWRTPDNDFVGLYGFVMTADQRKELQNAYTAVLLRMERRSELRMPDYVDGPIRAAFIPPHKASVSRVTAALRS